jgi:CDP-diacylglycerol--glycerol-3-phosphate 3-phosphatidyltransferase
MDEIEQNDLEIDNLPNRLTFFRVLLIPIVIGSLYIANSDFEFINDEIISLAGWVAAWTFTIASITDFFDGWVARRRGIITVFGSFLDPIADKFLTVSSLIMLQALGRIPAWIVIILVLREMYMTSLRLLASNEGIVVPVNNMGKWKTAIQMMGIPMLMCNETWWVFPFPKIGIVLIYIASILSLWSAVTYSASMIAKLKADRVAKREARKQKKLEKKLEKQNAN